MGWMPLDNDQLKSGAPAFLFRLVVCDRNRWQSLHSGQAFPLSSPLWIREFWGHHRRNPIWDILFLWCLRLEYNRLVIDFMTNYQYVDWYERKIDIEIQNETKRNDDNTDLDRSHWPSTSSLWHWCPFVVELWFHRLCQWWLRRPPQAPRSWSDSSGHCFHLSIIVQTIRINRNW